MLMHTSCGKRIPLWKGSSHCPSSDVWMCVLWDLLDSAEICWGSCAFHSGCPGGTVTGPGYAASLLFLDLCLKGSSLSRFKTAGVWGRSRNRLRVLWTALFPGKAVCISFSGASPYDLKLVLSAFSADYFAGVSVLRNRIKGLKLARALFFFLNPGLCDRNNE